MRIAWSRQTRSPSVPVLSGERTSRVWGWSLVRRRRRGRALVWRGVDHQREALLSGRQFGDVVLGMGAADVLLHGAVPLLANAALATAGAILVAQRTDDLVGAVRDGEAVGEISRWWHDSACRPPGLGAAAGRNWEA